MADLLFSDLSFDDVYLNLALEEVLLDVVSSGKLPPFVRVWKNPISIVMGISRRVNDDLFLEAIKADNITVARRISGGGTVYHDSGTASFSFFFPWELLGSDASPHKIDSASIDPFLDIIINAFWQIGLTGRKERISDVFVGDKKVSGSAQKRVKGAILHHGTILLDVDIESMSTYLKIPPEREEIPHDEFVTSLKNLGKSISIDDFKKMLSSSLKKLGHRIEKINLENNHPELLEKASQLALRTYSKPDWIFRR